MADFEAMADIHRELERARKHLLELTTRNRLLHVPQGSRAKLVRAFYARSEAVYERLVVERKKFAFVPVAEEEADAPGQVPEEDFADNQPAGSLLTDLTESALQKRLLSLELDARTYIEEQGVNILYLALGELKWFEDESSDIERHAPLLLIPVKIARSSIGARFRLEALEEDPSDNLTLAARLEEFRIKLPAFDPEAEGFSVGGYFAGVRAAVAGMKRWEVLDDVITLGFFSFSKFLMYRDLDPENWPEEVPLPEHPLVAALLGEGFRGEGPVLPEDAHLDERIPVERLSHVVDADSSQALAVEEVRSGRNLVIQGPPGTGKSQTITNLIATAILDGKTVLFVAEKMAALDVVRRRLEDLGLGAPIIELHSHRTSKKAFLDELARTLQLGKPTCDKAASYLRKLETVRDHLNTHSALLNEPVEPSGLTPFRVIGELTRLQMHPSGAPALPLPEAAGWTPEERGEGERLMVDLAEALLAVEPVQDHPWVGTRPDPLTTFQRDELQADIRACAERVQALRKAANALTDLVERDPSSGEGAIRFVVQAVLRAAEAPPHDPAAIVHAVWGERFPEIRTLVAEGTQFQSLRADLEGRVVEAAWETDLTTARQALAAHGQSWFRIFNGEYRASISRVRGLLRDPRSLPRGFAERLAFVDGLMDAQSLRRKILAAAPIGEAAFGKHWCKLDTDWGLVATLTEWIDACGDTAMAGEVRRCLGRALSPDSLRASGEAAAEAVEAFHALWTDLVGRLRLDGAVLFGEAEGAKVPLESILACLQAWRDQNEELTLWTRYAALAWEARNRGLAGLVDTLANGRVPPAEACVLYQKSYYRTVYEGLCEAHPALRNFDGERHRSLVDEFCQLDRARIEIAKFEVLLAHYERLPRMEGAVGALGVIKGEISKKRRHMSIRNLIDRAGTAVQAIKPVFMMSPLSVAQFLEPGKAAFDLIIFDEASQVRPVDALGAISRGGQLVVVGDSKQLPPSSFFSRIDIEDDFDDEADEPDLTATLGDMESILSLAAARGLGDKMLRWHYRSRHGSLIAVSNFSFYGNGLFIVPSPLADHPEYGLKFRFVEDGVYERGSRQQRNRVEARAVAARVMELARETPERSIGVAAFSMSQRDAIRDELEILRRADPSCEAYFTSAHEHEPFFIKNLENVQGDERDIILISVGYGRDANGYFSMNFGPINKEGGERRLNVLITRAKFRCEVFASVRARDIDLSRTASRGVVALKTFLEYAESGLLGTADPHTGREPDSPFEEAVKAAVEGEGHTVHAQVGVAGFFIDLAVVDPQAPGRYLLGIECDGARYHSSRSARERDRQRQAVLEAHGWTIHRIWSTDWFRDPQPQLARTLRSIENARRRGPGGGGPPSEKAAAAPLVFERTEADPAEFELRALAQPYVEFSRPVFPTDIHATPIELLAELLRDIVAAEGPVHEEEAFLRVRDAFGLTRIGPRIRERINHALRASVAEGWVRMEASFLYLPKGEVCLRNREAVVSATLRRGDRIPPEELTAALLLIVGRNHGVPEAELPPVVARLLGVPRATGDFASHLETHIADLLRQNRLLRQANGLLTLPG